MEDSSDSASAEQGKCSEGGGISKRNALCLLCVLKFKKNFIIYTFPLHSLFNKPFVWKMCIQLWEIISLVISCEDYQISE